MDIDVVYGPSYCILTHPIPVSDRPHVPSDHQRGRAFRGSHGWHTNEIAPGDRQTSKWARGGKAKGGIRCRTVKWVVINDGGGWE